MDKLYIVIPAYNEQETIQSVIEDWHPVAVNAGPESRLVIIDDGSKDNTYAMLKEAQEKYPQLIALTKPNGGHGATLLYGYKYALEQGADFVFQTDSDGQTKAEEFDEFWQQRNEYAMVIGHRNKREDGFYRVFVTKTLKFVCLLLFHVKLKDANTPFRLMQAGELAKILPLIPENYNLSNVVISVIFAKKKLPVKYIPITFRPRQGGVNSINMKRIFKIGKKAMGDFIKINKMVNQACKEDKKQK